LLEYKRRKDNHYMDSFYWEKVNEK
jgi:hypothetical protein